MSTQEYLERFQALAATKDLELAALGQRLDALALEWLDEAEAWRERASDIEDRKPQVAKRYRNLADLTTAHVRELESARKENSTP